MSDRQITWGGGQGESDGTSKALLEAGIMGTIFGSVGLFMMFTVLPNALKAYFRNGERPYFANYLLLFCSATLPGSFLMMWFDPKADFISRVILIITFGLGSLIMVKLFTWLGNKLVENGLTWAPGGGELRRRMGINFSFSEKLGALGGVGAFFSRLFAPADAATPSSVAALPPILREGETYVRGTKIVQAQALSNYVAAQYKPADRENLIQIGGVYVPFHVENMMWVIAGRTGSGKSQVYFNFLKAARKRGNPAMIADSDSGYYTRFGREGDLLFNPMDARSVKWSPFLDVKNVADCGRMAKAVIPDGNTPGDKIWSDFAQTLFADVLRELWKNGEHSTKKLLFYILRAEREELAALLSETSSAILTQEANEKMLGSARGSALPALAAWNYLPDVGDFSVRDWVREQADVQNGKWLFVTHRPDQMAELRTLISAVFELAMIETLTLTDNEERRFWFFFDEFDRMGKCQSAEIFSTNARKKGGCLVCGVQNKEQMDVTYGQGPASTLLSCLSSKVIMPQGNAASAKYWSDEIGAQDIERWESSVGNNSSNGLTGGNMNVGRNTGQSQRTVTQAAVMPADLQNMANLHGYLKLAELPTAQFVQTHQKIPQHGEAFVPVKELA